MSSLRLLSGAPYPDESMTSYLDRTAQFYGMSRRSLLLELGAGCSNGRRVPLDLDFRKLETLDRALKDAVPSWNAPEASRLLLSGEPLLKSQRHHYCPRCFVEDLAALRTPYFRVVWADIFVTHCAVHGTPLFAWRIVNGGRRQLPLAWIYRQDSSILGTMPEAMREDLANLKVLTDSERQRLPAPYSELSLKEALALVQRLQLLMKPQEARPAGLRTQPAYATMVNDLAAIAVRIVRDDKETAIADTLCPKGKSPWLSAMPGHARRRSWGWAAWTLARLGDVGWRRTWQLFTARILASMPGFSSLFVSAEIPLTPWETWIESEVLPALGPIQRSRLAASSASLLRRMR